ncbi:hypothetical protein NE237_016836 [Protea cynaroides]|uniref:Uncharacterized protein n=1 Tax=Protea cynaroides TaxID=273540 RepID=A0A9Q0HEJ8_9MAGN|nr:hypothetical protein NE237_016836 [Protea cynaroides]
MGGKLIELGRQLKTEIEAKNRTEKKLKFQTKKLESLKFALVSDYLSSMETSSGLKTQKKENPILNLQAQLKVTVKTKHGREGSTDFEIPKRGWKTFYFIFFYNFMECVLSNNDSSKT